jgi:hypothetical protein
MEKIGMGELSKEDKVFLDKMITLGSALDRVGHWKSSLYDSWA